MSSKRKGRAAGTDAARTGYSNGADYCRRCGRLARVKSEIMQAALRGVIPHHVADALIAVSGLRHE